mmetsp:Transcript_9471/g.26453  ORF Transcript_9471/g.26453 Transcript_9471/m.26453 type:complete len:210 (+) Transcript_9471:352-981(+)
MPLCLEVVEDLPMVVKHMREDAIKTSSHGLEVFRVARRHSAPNSEMLRIRQQSSGTVYRVHHVVDRRTLLRLSVRGAEILPLVGCSHLGASLRSALLPECDQQHIEFDDELSEVLVLPNKGVRVRAGELIYSLYIASVLADQVLYVLWQGKRPRVLIETPARPLPHSLAGGAWKIPSQLRRSLWRGRHGCSPSTRLGGIPIFTRHRSEQ